MKISGNIAEGYIVTHFLVHTVINSKLFRSFSQLFEAAVYVSVRWFYTTVLLLTSMVADPDVCWTRQFH